MKRLRLALDAALANPKTTSAGIAGIVMVVSNWIHNPGSLADPLAWTTLATSAALLAALDPKRAKARRKAKT